MRSHSRKSQIWNVNQVMQKIRFFLNFVIPWSYIVLKKFIFRCKYWHNQLSLHSLDYWSLRFQLKFFFSFFSAMCFYVPRAVWFNVFSHHFVDINAIVDLLTSFDNAVNPETRDPAVMQVAKHIDRFGSLKILWKLSLETRNLSSSTRYCDICLKDSQRCPLIKKRIQCKSRKKQLQYKQRTKYPDFWFWRLKNVK